MREGRIGGRRIRHKEREGGDKQTDRQTSKHGNRERDIDED